MIRVLIAEDQSMVGGALAALLGIEPDITIIGVAKDGREALELTVRDQPDVLLTDIEMPHMTGLEVAAAINERKRDHPDDVCACGLSAEGAGCACVGVSAEGLAVGSIGECDTDGEVRWKSGGSGTGARGVDGAGSAE
jgi:CheY-like chemotaxis protein